MDLERLWMDDIEHIETKIVARPLPDNDMLIYFYEVNIPINSRI